MMKLLALFALVALTAAYTIPEQYEQFEDEGHYRLVRSIDQDLQDEQEYDVIPVVYIRERRSLQPGAPSFPMPQNDPNVGNHVDGDVTKQGPNTAATIKAQHGTDRYQVGGEWSKVVRGPNKAKPNWSIRGTYKW